MCTNVARVTKHNVSMFECKHLRCQSSRSCRLQWRTFVLSTIRCRTLFDKSKLLLLRPEPQRLLANHSEFWNVHMPMISSDSCSYFEVVIETLDIKFAIHSRYPLFKSPQSQATISPLHCISNIAFCDTGNVCAHYNILLSFISLTFGCHIQF